MAKPFLRMSSLPADGGEESSMVVEGPFQVRKLIGDDVTLG